MENRWARGKLIHTWERLAAYGSAARYGLRYKSNGTH